MSMSRAQQAALIINNKENEQDKRQMLQALEVNLNFLFTSACNHMDADTKQKIADLLMKRPSQNKGSGKGKDTGKRPREGERDTDGHAAKAMRTDAGSRPTVTPPSESRHTVTPASETSRGGNGSFLLRKANSFMDRSRLRKANSFMDRSDRSRKTATRSRTQGETAPASRTGGNVPCPAIRALTAMEKVQVVGCNEGVTVLQWRQAKKTQSWVFGPLIASAFPTCGSRVGSRFATPHEIANAQPYWEATFSRWEAWKNALQRNSGQTTVAKRVATWNNFKGKTDTPMLPGHRVFGRVPHLSDTQQEAIINSLPEDLYNELAMSIAALGGEVRTR